MPIPRPLALHLVATLSLALSGIFLQAEIVINEIHYHPVEEPAFAASGQPALSLWDDIHEFVELHNTAEAPADVSGWKFTRGVKFTFPEETTIPASGFIVIAKNPTRLRTIPQYALTAATVYGPWTGKLSNRGETLELQDAAGDIVDSVSYSDGFPWPTGADALGAGVKWSGQNPQSYQYRGRSLERVSSTYPTDLPENWLASGTSSNPSPGRANAVTKEAPDPIVVFLQHRQQSNGASIIAPNQPAVITCALSHAPDDVAISADYFVDNVDRDRDPISTISLARETAGERITFSGVIPALPAHSILRYRVSMTVNGLKSVVSPRPGEPFSAHGYFVDPTTAGSENQFYLYGSLASKEKLDDNAKYNPLDGNNSSRFEYGSTRSSGWNDTVSGYFAHKGKWWDVQFRYQGSPYFRGKDNPFSGGTARTRFKLKFPDYDPFRGRSAILIMAKGTETSVGHDIVRHAGLPIAETESIRISVNKTASITRLLVSEMNGDMLGRYHDKQASLNPDDPKEDSGHIVKASGLFSDAGPWGNGDGLPLRSNRGWDADARYAWTYPSKNKDWLGYGDFKRMLQGHVDAGGPVNGFALTASQRTGIRNYANQFWDIPKVLDYYVLTNWMNFWDDNSHNYFFWQQRNGKWAMLPWDFDQTQDTASYNEIIGNQFERSFILAFEEEYEDRLALHVNTTLHPDELSANGFPSATVTMARGLRSSVNRTLQIGTFPQPNRPTNTSPGSGANIPPRTTLAASGYDFSTSPTRSHQSTLWEIRHDGSTYDAPVLRVRSTDDLTSLPVPEGTLAPGEKYHWRCTYFATNGTRSIVSRETSFNVTYAIASSGVLPRISEIMADNETALEHDGAFLDWVEICNATSETLDLSGMGVSDNPYQSDQYTIPDGTTLGAGECLVLWCATPPPTATGLYTGFGLGRTGDALYLFSAPRVTGSRSLVDYRSFGHQVEDLSIGLHSGGTWSLLVSPTPGAPNTDAAPLGDVATLRINEWMARSGGADWFELYNPSELPVSLSGLVLSDQSDDETTIAPLSYIGAKSHAVFQADGKTTDGTEHVAFSLDAASDSILLARGNGQSIDRVDLWNAADGIAEGRIPDGTDSYAALPGGSAGRANPDPSDPDGDGDGMPSAWEVANGLNPNSPSDATRDLDADGMSNLHEFIAGTDPTNANSVLQLQIAAAGDDVRFTFDAITGKTYRLQSTPTLSAADWTTVHEFPTAAADEQATHQIPFSDVTEAYFRLVTP